MGMQFGANNSLTLLSSSPIIDGELGNNYLIAGIGSLAVYPLISEIRYVHDSPGLGPLVSRLISKSFGGKQPENFTTTFAYP